MPDDVMTRPPQATPEPAASSQEAADTRDLAGFGYKQELKRILGFYSSFAVAFSYISPSTGIFTLYALGLGIGGPFFFWSWPLVALGQFIIALNFAEVSSHFPVAGSVYQWTKYLSNRAYSWITGWVYLFAGILTVTAVDVTIPIVLIPLLNYFGLNIPNTAEAQVIIAALILISTTVLNIYGVRLVAIVNNTGVVFEILGMVVFAIVLLIFTHHQSAGVVFNTNALGSGFGNQAGTFLAAMFMSLFVIYGFDTASTLAEETKNPRREAPRAVLAAVIGAFIIGAIFLYSTIIAIPGDVDKYVANTAAAKVAPPVDIITSNLPGWAGELYLVVVFLAIAATGMIYFSYLLGNIAILIARTKGWPTEGAPFKLGGWGTIVNVLGLVWGGSMLINFLWPRAASNPNLSALPNFPNLGAIGNVPIFEATILVIVVVGAIYYLIAQRGKTDQVVRAA